MASIVDVPSDIMSVEQPEAEQRLSPNQIHEQLMYWLEGGRRLPFIPYPDVTYTFFRAAVAHEQPDGYSIYASTALTSGGAVLPRDDGREVPFAEGLRANEVYSVNLMQAVIDENPDLVSELIHVNPVFVGKVPIYHFEQYGEVMVVDRYWNQAEYLQYWFAVIVGIEANRLEGDTDADHWQRTLEVIRTLFSVHSELCADDIELMNDRTAAHELRVQAYQHFTEVFVALVNELNRLGAITVDPVKYLIGLIDNKRSFGGRSEEQLGELFGAKALQIILSGNDWSRTPVAAMAEDLGHHGAEFAVPAGEIRLALARKLGVSITPVDLSDEDRRALADEPRRRRAKSQDDFRENLRPTIHSSDQQEVSQLLEKLTEVAVSTDSDKRHLFHPLMIDEVLRPGSVDVDAQQRSQHDPLDETARALNAIYYLRHPAESWR